MVCSVFNCYEKKNPTTFFHLSLYFIVSRLFFFILPFPLFLFTCYDFQCTWTRFSEEACTGRTIAFWGKCKNLEAVVLIGQARREICFCHLAALPSHIHILIFWIEKIPHINNNWMLILVYLWDYKKCSQ